MKFKKYLKIGSLLGVTAAISFSVLNTTNANSTYRLNNTVNGYVNASNASNRVNARSKYTAGEYYVYKQSNGMYNISKTKGQPGAWINPNDNKKVVFESITSSTNGEEYILQNEVKTYSTASDASNNRNARSTYSKGKYFIYKKYKGMLNISRRSGEAGAWINPSENYQASIKRNESSQKENIKKAEKPVQTNTEVSNSYVLNKAVNTYTNASDALNSRNARSTYSKGRYYIYKEYKGMLNISKKNGEVGAWINPSENKIEVQREPNYPKVETKTNKYTVNKPINVYRNATDALFKINPVTQYSSGSYYIYKKNQNMINISRYENRAGGWINPSENIKTEVKVESETKTQNLLALPYSREVIFLNKISGHAQKLASENDLYASVMIAQAMLESAYGTSELGSEPNYNLFGIKGSYQGQSVPIYTGEHTREGEKYMIVANFRKYPSYYESLTDYVNVLTGGNRVNSWRYKFYAGARFSNTNSYKDATAHLTGRYATSPTYGTKLNELIERFDLTRFDMQK